MPRDSKSRLGASGDLRNRLGSSSSKIDLRGRLSRRRGISEGDDRPHWDQPLDNLIVETNRQKFEHIPELEEEDPNFAPRPDFVEDLREKLHTSHGHRQMDRDVIDHDRQSRRPHRRSRSRSRGRQRSVGRRRSRSRSRGRHRSVENQYYAEHQPPYQDHQPLYQDHQLSYQDHQIGYPPNPNFQDNYGGYMINPDFHGPGPMFDQSYNNSPNLGFYDRGFQDLASNFPAPVPKMMAFQDPTPNFPMMLPEPLPKYGLDHQQPTSYQQAETFLEGLPVPSSKARKDNKKNKRKRNGSDFPRPAGPARTSNSVEPMILAGEDPFASNSIERVEVFEVTDEKKSSPERSQAVSKSKKKKSKVNKKKKDAAFKDFLANMDDMALQEARMKKSAQIAKEKQSKRKSPPRRPRTSLSPRRRRQSHSPRPSRRSRSPRRRSPKDVISKVKSSRPIKVWDDRVIGPRSPMRSMSFSLSPPARFHGPHFNENRPLSPPPRRPYSPGLRPLSPPGMRRPLSPRLNRPLSPLTRRYPSPRRMSPGRRPLSPRFNRPLSPRYERPLSPRARRPPPLSPRPDRPLSPRYGRFSPPIRPLSPRFERPFNRPLSPVSRRPPSPRFDRPFNRPLSPRFERPLHRPLSPRFDRPLSHGFVRPLSPWRRPLSPLRPASPRNRPISPRYIQSISPRNRTLSPRYRPLSPPPRPLSPRYRQSSPPKRPLSPLINRPPPPQMNRAPPPLMSKPISPPPLRLPSPPMRPRRASPLRFPSPAPRQRQISPMPLRLPSPPPPLRRKTAPSPRPKRPVSPWDNPSQPAPPAPRRKGAEKVVEPLAAKVGLCPCCGSEQHAIQNCQPFIEMTVLKRWDTINKYVNVCSKCLCTGHNYINCKNDAGGCILEGCKGQHHTLLHKESNTKVVVKREIVDLVSDDEDNGDPKVKRFIVEQTANNAKGTCMLCESKDHTLKNCPDLFCYKCKKTGHFGKDCKEKNVEKCAYCKLSGHHINHCPIIKCRKCGENGHAAMVCTKEDETVPCMSCGKTGHHVSECPTIECRNCGKLGHMSKGCPEPMVITCFNCDIKGHHIRDCPFSECRNCGAPGHWDRDCQNRPNQFKKAAPNVANSSTTSIDYHHLGSDELAQPFPRPKGSMLGFLCDKLLAQGRALVLGDEMMHTWRLAGHNEDTLYELLRRQRPANKTQLRLILVKELANASAGSIPLSVQISELLDQTVDFYMPNDRVNLVEHGKLSVTPSSSAPPRPPRNMAMPTQAPLRLESKGVGEAMNTSLSFEKLSKLSAMIDLKVGPPDSEDRKSFESRVDNLEPLRVFMLEKMRDVAKEFSISESYVQKAASTIVKVLAGTNFSLYILRRHLTSYGAASLAELMTAKVRFYEPHFPTGINCKYIVTFVLDYLEEFRFAEQ